MRRPDGRGFTLIELMITVAIVGILAAVAYPSYDKFVTKSRRSDAHQLMTEISSKQVQYLLDARGYTDKIGTKGLNIARDKWTCAADSNAGCTSQYYTVTVSSLNNNATPPYYKATAVPVVGSAQAADGNLTLDSTGAKTGTW